MTEMPARLSSYAAVAPAGPSPTTSTSQVLGSGIACIELRYYEDAQNGHPTRPKARKNRRRTLWSTLRVLESRERSSGKGASRRTWGKGGEMGPVSASSLSQVPADAIPLQKARNHREGVRIDHHPDHD